MQPYLVKLTMQESWLISQDYDQIKQDGTLKLPQTGLILD
jgi:hypothetical protein